MTDVQFFTSDRGVTAYKQTQTGSPVSVFYLSGHRTNFDSGTRNRLVTLCAKMNVSLTHYTYFGWDQSICDGVPSNGEGYIQDWLQQAFDLYDQKTQGPQIIVGSSMGSYLALALAQARPERIKGLIGLAGGFGQNLSAMMTALYGEYRVGTATEKGFTFSLENDGSLPIRGSLDITCPIRLLHAMSDDVVSYKNTDHIAKAVVTDDVIIRLTKSGSHKLDLPRDTMWLEHALAEIIAHSAP